jgi:hypothetical protein
MVGMDEEVIPVLRVADAAAAVRWYERLGFTKQWEYRFEPECPAFVSVARGRAQPAAVTNAWTVLRHRGP